MVHKFKKRLAALACALLFTIALPVACSPDNPQITGLSSLEFYEQYVHLLESDGGAVIIDGRTDEMFSRGHLPLAINIDADNPQLKELLQPYADEPLIVVYCTTIRRTSVIVGALITFYEGQIIYINDGLVGWIRNGLPVANLPAAD